MKFHFSTFSLLALVATSLPTARLHAQGTSNTDARSANTSVPPLTLGDAIRLAARNSASAQSAELRADEADARVRQSKSALFPNISAVGQYGARTFNTSSFGIEFPSAPGEPPLFDPAGEVVGPVKNIDYRGRIAQSIFDLSAFARIRSAKSLATSSHADAAAVAEQAGSAAAVAYIRALRTEDNLQARNADSVLAADLLNIAQQQLNAGVGIVLDVTRAKAQVAATHAQLIASRNARDRTRIELLRALGLPLSTPLVLSDSLALLKNDGLVTNEAEAVELALKRRPDLQAAEAQVDAAKRAVGAIRAERLPSLSFVGDRGINGVKYNRLLNTYTYAFQVTLPIFDGFRREGRVQEREAQIREAEIHEKDLRDQVTADVQSALLDLAAAQEQVDATREQLRLSEQEVSQARERFSAGVAGNADVITASLSLTSARTAVIDVLTNYQAARVALARAQGAITTLP